MTGASAAAISFSVIKHQAARGYPANSKVKLGLIGCGGRGIWIAKLFKENGNYELTAGADYFKDRVDQCQGLGVKADMCFTGLSGYKKLLDQDIDAVAVISPPYFHPQQASDAVDAGKHVYLAKPIAVDVPGCKTIQETGNKASMKKLCCLVDFQTRADQFYTEALKRVHQGAIGEFAFGESIYHAGIPWGSQMKLLQENPTNPEVMIRAWGMSQELSGDIITEQNIHTLDVMSWIMDCPPVHADGSGARTVRPVGNCYDHFTCHYQYPNNVGITFSSRQFPGHGTQPEGIRNRMFGNKGVLETEYGGQVIIRGENFYRGGRSPGIYKEGAQKNIADFFENISKGNYDNDTVKPSVRSNLVTILGRTAAYTHKRVTWTELLKSTEVMEPNLKGLKS